MLGQSAGEAGQGRKAVPPPSRQHSEHGCIQLWIGPRTVPVRSGPDGSPTWGFSGHPGAFRRAANRDGSRSGELDAATQNERNLVKVLDIPKSGRCGLTVAYQSRYGNCQRAWVLPDNPRTPAQRGRRKSFGHVAGAWSRVLTQLQREAWNVAGPKVQSKTRLGQSGKLTGQQFFQGICSARACIAAGMLLTPPAPVVFGPNVTGHLAIRNGENGVRLLLSVTGPVTEDIMVYGQ